MARRDWLHLWSTGTQVPSPTWHSELRIWPLPQLQCGVQLWLGSYPWRRNSMCQGATKKVGGKAYTTWLELPLWCKGIGGVLGVLGVGFNNTLPGTVGLRLWRCQKCSLGWNWVSDPIPGQEAPYARGAAKKWDKKKKKSLYYMTVKCNIQTLTGQNKTKTKTHQKRRQGGNRSYIFLYICGNFNMYSILSF